MLKNRNSGMFGYKHIFRKHSLGYKCGPSMNIIKNKNQGVVDYKHKKKHNQTEKMARENVTNKWPKRIDQTNVWQK